MKKQIYLKFTTDEAKDIIYISENFDLHKDLIFRVYSPEEKFLIFSLNETKDLGKGFIKLHKKNRTNTYFTINSLNTLAEKENLGIDENGRKIVNWEEYKDTIILVKEGKINVIKIIDQDNLKIIRRGENPYYI